MRRLSPEGALRSRAFVVALICCAAVTGAPASAASPAQTAARRLIAARLAALSAGDWKAYRRLLDLRFIHVSDRGERRTVPELRSFVQQSGGRGATYSVSRVTAREVGRLLIAQAQVEERRPGFDGSWVETDTFVRRPESWRFLAHQETSLPVQAARFPAPQPLRDFVGSYTSASGGTDLIREEAGRLTARSHAGDPGTPLIPIAPGAFRVAGDVTIVSFIRDGAGAVTGCFWHLPSGQVTLSTRTPLSR